MPPGSTTSVNRRSIARPAEQAQRRSGRLGLEHAVAKFAQAFHGVGADPVIVLHDQDRLFPAALGRGDAAVTASSLLVAERARKVDVDRRALADLAVEPHVAARLLDEAVDHAEARARCPGPAPWW